MKISDAIQQFTDDLEFGAMITYCGIFQVPHNETEWLADEFPDKEDDLRVALAEAMERAADK